MHAHILTNAHPQAQLNSCGCLLQMFLFPRMAEGKSIRVHYDKQEWNPRQHDIFRAWRKGNTGYGTLAHRLCSVVSLLKQGHTTYMLVCFVTCMRICVCVCVCAGSYPIVDAAMRELWSTGWIQTNVRMAAASFLCEFANCDWRLGEVCLCLCV